MSSFPAYALPCSPGIPCTGYNINTDTTANTDQNINGPKSGNAGWTAGSPPTYTHEQSACDGNFMNQIYARAFMEAQREVMLSEQIIHKPDSVLEYTCFDQYVGLATQHIDSIFSANQSWLNKSVPRWTIVNSDTVTLNDSGNATIADQTDYSVFEDDRLDNNLETLLLDTIEEYIDNNFNHTFMGESITLDNNMNMTAFPTSYDCAHMLAIWEIAKCIDFGEDDRFRSFNDLTMSDIRSIPLACPVRDRVASDGSGAVTPTVQIASDAVVGGITSTKVDQTASPGDTLTIPGLGAMPSQSITISGLTLSTGSDFTRMPSDAPNFDCPPSAPLSTDVNTDISNDLIRVANNCDDGTELNVYSSVDIMKSYEEIIKGLAVGIPGAGTSSGTILCGDPIPTGLPVMSFTHTKSYDTDGLPFADRMTFVHYDYICANPGCFYQPVKVPYDPSLPVPDASSISVGQCLPSF